MTRRNFIKTAIGAVAAILVPKVIRSLLPADKTYGPSVFQSSLRSHIQVQEMEKAMLCYRIEKAPKRYKWTIEANHFDPEKVKEEVKKWRTSCDKNA